MQTDIAISEDFEPYNDEDELRRLIRAVKFSKKHFLYFVCCNQVPKQNELISEVKKNFKGRKIKVVRFKRRITDLLGELQKRKIAADCEAIFVQGLEYSINSDGKGDENAVIYNLNITRDSFKRYFNCPLFLWLPEYALVKITRHAPDFFSVRSGTFYFSNPPEKVTEQIFQSISSGWNEISSLPVAEKHKQIKNLESLLGEYRGLHKEKQDKQAEARLLNQLGDFYYSISEYRKAIEFYEQSLKIKCKIGNRLGESVSLSGLGIAHYGLGEYQKATDFHRRSLAISREIGDRHGESNSLNNLGSVYGNLGEYQKAIGFYEQTLEISRKINDPVGVGRSLGNLGLAYNSLGEYQKAIEFHGKSLEIFREIGDLKGEGISLGNLGIAYGNLGDYQKAIDYHEQFLAISREVGDRLGEGGSLSNLGLDYNKLGEREKACGLWKEALAIFEAIESPTADVVRGFIKENCPTVKEHG